MQICLLKSLFEGVCCLRSQFQKCLNLISERKEAFFKKYINHSSGGRNGLTRNFPKISLFLLVTPPLINCVDKLNNFSYFKKLNQNPSLTKQDKFEDFKLHLIKSRKYNNLNRNTRKNNLGLRRVRFN